MPSWNLTTRDPLSLTLSADARLAATDYVDDQTWELRMGGGEPAALALQTTYGLRAHWMRLFPRFVRGDSARTDPAAFHSPPRLVCFYPNFLAVIYEPFDGLEVLAEYWAPESNLVVGRIRLTNNSILPINFKLEWVGMLNPIEHQGGMTTRMVGPACVLEGETAYLHPVVTLTGGAQPSNGPYPALSHELELYPSISRQFSWACASMRTYEDSLEAARTATGRPWEAEQVRVEMLNFSQSVEIQTGNPHWDAAIALAQKTANALLMKNPIYLPDPSFVLSRQPDHGFSARGDGNEYSHLWNGQTAFDAYYLASLLLPGAPELVTGLLNNFLSVQEDNGEIDWKPGMGGQRSRRLAQPMLASLALQAAPYVKDTGWLRSIFPNLLRFFNAWFEPAHDRDGDGFPEWESPLQTALEDSPMFDRTAPGAQGLDITCLESPALAAMLYRECQSLVEIAETLVETEKAETAYARLSGAAQTLLSGAEEALAMLRERAEQLRQAVESTWDEKAHRYAYRDYQTHLSQPGKLLTEFNGTRHFNFKRRFQQPQRLIVQLKVREERTYAAVVTLHGYNADGEVSEVLPPRSFSWLGTEARATTQNNFLALRRIEVEGMSKEDRLLLFTADTTIEDCSLLLPLWAGTPDEARAGSLVRDTLLPRYLLPYGIPLCPLPPQPAVPAPKQPPAVGENAPDGESMPPLEGEPSLFGLPVDLPPKSFNQVSFAWNHLVGEGLLRYGYRAEAAALVTRMMNAAALALATQQAFGQSYDAYTGQAGQERGHLHGIAPVGLFLQTLGIRKLDPREILLDGFNPFPSTIIVKYRKVTLTCHPDRTEIAFPGGQSITIDQPDPHRITRS